MEKMRMESVDMTAQNIDKIAKLFPNCITEMRDEQGRLKKAVNFDMLRQMLSPDVVEGDEAYEFTWVGKKASIVEANRPIHKTLRPCPEESVDWDATENLYIEGDNLEVLKLLQESYLGMVKMIYIDPPYNTGNDFIYRDNFAMSGEEYKWESGQVDEETGNRLFKNTDTNGRFHSDWCSMMYSRLMLARNLLCNDGVIFISINDSEIDSLKKICSEIFGAANNVATLIWQQRKGGGNDSRYIAVDHEYILIFSKNIASLNGKWRIAQSNEYLTRYKETEADGRRFYWDTLVRNGLQNPIVISVTAPDGNDITINSQWSKNRVLEGLNDGTVRFAKTNTGWSLHHKVYMKEGQVLRSLLTEYGNNRNAGQELAGLFGEIYFSYAKPTKLIELLQTLCTSSTDIIMDFFSGSATTAQAVMQLNVEDGGHRKFIMVQLPETCDEKSEAYKSGFPNICEIGKERIRRAAKKIAADNPGKPFDGGFRVFKLADTNMSDIYYSSVKYNQIMLPTLEPNFKPDRTSLDLLFHCLLEWGLPLSLPYTSEQIDCCTVHNYNDNDFVACFDENITERVIRAIALIQPLRAVFRDACFAASSDRASVYEYFKLLSPNTRVRVI